MQINGKNINLRLIEIDDSHEYYKSAFEFMDKEVMRCTGTKNIPDEEMIKTYVKRIVEDDSRYDFLILSRDGEIIGEVVLNEIDEDTRSGHFRIALFNSKYFGQGIGTEATKLILNFGFSELNLHRIELEVFDFNERGYKAYRRCGFKEEGRKRDAEFIDGKYCDIIIMGILEDEFNL